VPPSDELSAAELRARATRVRRLARDFEHDEAAPRLRALADELDKRADALEAAAQDDEGRGNRVGASFADDGDAHMPARIVLAHDDAEFRREHGDSALGC
jgi:hypothetical protein